MLVDAQVSSMKTSRSAGENELAVEPDPPLLNDVGALLLDSVHGLFARNGVTIEEALERSKLNTRPCFFSARRAFSIERSNSGPSASRMASLWASMRVELVRHPAPSGERRPGHVPAAHTRRAHPRTARQPHDTSRLHAPQPPHTLADPPTELSTCPPASTPADSSNHL